MLNRIDLTLSPWQFALCREQDEPAHIAFTDEICLPSTVSQLHKSPRSDTPSDGHLHDPWFFEGYAFYQKRICLRPDPRCVYELVLERTRASAVWVNGVPLGSRNSLCTPHRYDVTACLNDGSNEITLRIDNRTCPVAGGHMTSPDMQTNWLGITGEVAIEQYARAHVRHIRVTPLPDSAAIEVCAQLTGCGNVAAWVDGYEPIALHAEDAFSFRYEMPGAQPWSEHTPALYRLHLRCGEDEAAVSFGLRRFEACGTELRLNGKRIFLRGKHEGLLFPLTGAAPTDRRSWLSVLKTARSYGINHYRFHTCCPPEAAFEAADELGMYLEPELPFWGTIEAQDTPGQAYLVDEGYRILNSFANHPSFFALSLGNELWGNRERLNAILGAYKAHDPRVLYTQGANNFQFQPCTVPNDDFFIGVRLSEHRLIRGSYAMCDAPQGMLQTHAPSASFTYDEAIRPSSAREETASGGTKEIQYGTGVKTVALSEEARPFTADMPVVSHEVGQYFVYPDFREISHYKGVLKPGILTLFRSRLEKAGLLPLAYDYFRASGLLAAACYKLEIEAALRSNELSGFQLLDLQDYPGQGGAFVGMLNALMESKGLITPQEWRCFCADEVLLGCLPKFVYQAGERVALPVKLYAYGCQPVCDPTITVSLSFGGVTRACTLSARGSFLGGVFDMGEAELTLPEAAEPGKALLSLSCGALRNHYELWVFPRVPQEEVYVTDWSEARARLLRGERVLFLPQRLTRSVEGAYCADFWNYPMFASISDSMHKPRPVGTLGLLIDEHHPALRFFPTESYSTPQWYDIVTDSESLILDGTDLTPIVRTMDNCLRNHSLALLFEAQVGPGRLLVCCARLNRHPDSLSCAALLHSLTRYVSSDLFRPAQNLPPELPDEWFC